MGFFSSFGRNIGGMFGLTGVMGESEAQKLQAKLQAAKDKMNGIFRAGVMQNERAELKFNEQILNLIISEQDLSKAITDYNRQLQQHDSSITNIRLLVTVALVIVILIFLMFFPKCC
jgi:predicted PurR-regulated permease PerM